MNPFPTGNETSDPWRPRVMLRIRGSPDDLGVTGIKKTLRLDDADLLLEEVYVDEHDGIVGCEFRNVPQLSSEEATHWQLTAFRNATTWLRARSAQQFQELEETGRQSDFCVVGYTGPIPNVLLTEIVRLGLSLFIIQRPPDLFSKLPSH
jgi:hypothetical protein